jgi:hypothetical protein
MIFAMVDVELRDHEKAHNAGAAMGTWTWVLLYTRAKQLDGFVPAVALRGAWAGEAQAKKDMARLVSVGLATEEANGWRLHNYAAKNNTLEEIEANRAAARERKAKSRRDKLATSHVTPPIVTRDTSQSHTTEQEQEQEQEQDSERERARAPEGDPWPLTPEPYAAGVFAAVGMASGVILDGTEIPAMWCQFVGHLEAESKKPGATPRPATRAEWQRWVSREARRKQESAAKTRDAPNRRGSLLQHDPKGPGYETGDWDGT